MCDQGQRHLYAAMSAVDPNLPPIDYLQQIGLAYISFGLEHPDYFLLMFTFEPPHSGAEAPDEAIMQALRAEGSPYQILEQAIERGIAAGLFVVRPGFDLNEMAYAACPAHSRNLFFWPRFPNSVQFSYLVRITPMSQSALVVGGSGAALLPLDEASGLRSQESVPLHSDALRDTKL